VKQFLRSKSVQNVLSWILAQYIRVVYLTSRWSVMGAEHPQALLAQGKPFIVCFWHGRILMMPQAWAHVLPMHVLISEHRDGRLISRTMDWFTIHTVVGSSSRGATTALREMVRLLRARNCVAITPDGPRGPRMRAAQGVVAAARLAGVPIIPLTFSTTRGRNARSWDRFLVAFPFGRGLFIWGAPIVVPGDADQAVLEQYRRKVEDALNDLTAQADRQCGRDPVAPMPESAVAAGSK
jgi:lysophospholipid acyltransferase (LPLAT)-like uncharacterized protein